MDALLQGLGAYASPGEPAAKLPPVADWNPPFCGDIDMRIARDGSWHYNGTPILRPAMVQMFSRILRRDPDRYVLVTPVEKVGIVVEDVPFIAVAMTVDSGLLTFRTNVGDIVPADNSHALRFDMEDGFKPYIHIRDGLEARLSRELARDVSELIDVSGPVAGIASGEAFFSIDMSNAT